jgi:GT2 family glycosyltransferase
MLEFENKLISIAIVTWNRKEYVIRAIKSIYDQPYRPIEIVVVDSNSSDGTVESIKNAFPEVKIIRLHRNMGCPEGRNIALANCSGDIIFSLDDDAWLHLSTLELCVQKFHEEQNIGVIACRIVDPNGETKDIRKEYYTTSFAGGAFVIKKEILNKAGYFPSDYFRQAEEGDLALRILDKGYNIYYYPKAIVYHEKAPINRNNKLFMYYACRNELYTVIRRYPIFLVPLAIFWKILVWNLAGINNKAIHYTLFATIFTLVRFPFLLWERKPVSLKTVKKIMNNKLSLKP